MNFDTIDFCRHIYQYGLVLEPSSVKIDGRSHNCRMIDNAQGRKAGSYIIYPNTGIAKFKSWRDRVIHTYKQNGSMSQFDFNQIMKEERKKQYALWFQVSKDSYRKYIAIPHSNLNSQYLERKLIKLDSKNHDCKIDKLGNLIIPYYNAKGYLTTLQTIWQDGSKYFEKGGQLTGCFNKIGFNSINSSYTDIIFIGEGFATMASIFEAFQKPCIVAANCGNLVSVLDNLNNLYPSAKFVICADNDISLREIPPGSKHMVWSNPGLEAAINCQSLYSCDIAYPEFNPDSSGTDFNDLHVASGIIEVQKQISCQLKLKVKEKELMVKENYSKEKYLSHEKKYFFDNVRNYFEYFGEYVGSLSVLVIDDMQVEIKSYEEISITNIFLNYKLVIVEQIHSSEVLIKYDKYLLQTFKKQLSKHKDLHIIELDKQFNIVCEELKILKENNTLLKDSQHG